MLAQIERPTNDFHALARYLVRGREDPPNPDRVAWMFAQNLPTSDPDNAATLMAATAALSKRCTSACYHVMIAWHERERPTPETMQEVAVKTLHLAGLAEHQAFVMGHGDKPHRHLHMMINRVHPTTGRAWDTKNDYARFDRIMRQLSDEYGYEFVPAHRFNPELTDDLPKKPNSAATYAARRGANTRRTQWSPRASRELAARVSERLDAASSWQDVAELFAEEGLALEAKGKGHVVGNATSYTKLSALGLQKTANGFAKRRPPARRPPERRAALKHAHPLMDAVDVARGLALFGLADRDDVRSAVQEARGQRLAWLARKPLIDQLLEGLRQTLAAWTAHTPPPARKPKPHRRSKSSTRRKSPSYTPHR